MPGFDRTGPMGAGPMTGGARGFCNAQSAVRTGNMPDYSGAGYGRGLGLRRGFGGGRGGRGWSRGYGARAGWYAPYPQAAAPGYMPPADELEYLKQQAADAADTLAALNQRIDALSKDSADSE